MTYNLYLFFATKALAHRKGTSETRLSLASYILHSRILSTNLFGHNVEDYVAGFCLYGP